MHLLQRPVHQPSVTEKDALRIWNDGYPLKPSYSTPYADWDVFIAPWTELLQQNKLRITNIQEPREDGSCLLTLVRLRDAPFWEALGQSEVMYPPTTYQDSPWHLFIEEAGHINNPYVFEVAPIFELDLYTSKLGKFWSGASSSPGIGTWLGTSYIHPDLIALFQHESWWAPTQSPLDAYAWERSLFKIGSRHPLVNTYTDPMNVISWYMALGRLATEREAVAIIGQMWQIILRYEPDDFGMYMQSSAEELVLFETEVKKVFNPSVDWEVIKSMYQRFPESSDPWFSLYQEIAKWADLKSPIYSCNVTYHSGFSAMAEVLNVTDETPLFEIYLLGVRTKQWKDELNEAVYALPEQLH